MRDKDNNSEFTPVPEYVNLNMSCVVKEHRKIRNDHTFSYGKKFYLIESPLKNSIAKQKIEIRKAEKNRFTACFAGRPLKISEVVEPTKLLEEELEVQKKLDVLSLADTLGNVRRCLA